MARKNGDKKYLGNVKVNASVYDTQENSGRKVGIVKNSPKIGSPTKRLRSISKKKWIRCDDYFWVYYLLQIKYYFILCELLIPSQSI